MVSLIIQSKKFMSWWKMVDNDNMQYVSFSDKTQHSFCENLEIRPLAIL